MTYVLPLGLLALVLVAAIGLVALGVLVAQRLRRQSAPVVAVATVETPIAAVDPRPLPASPVPLPGDEEHYGEAWLAIGKLPVNARQLALVMAKLPVGTQFAGMARDDVNGDGAMKLGFTHWQFAAANPEKYPNGPRLWVSWANADEPVVSWPLVNE